MFSGEDHTDLKQEVEAMRNQLGPDWLQTLSAQNRLTSQGHSQSPVNNSKNVTEDDLYLKEGSDHIASERSTEITTDSSKVTDQSLSTDITTVTSSSQPEVSKSSSGYDDIVESSGVKKMMESMRELEAREMEERQRYRQKLESGAYEEEKRQREVQQREIYARRLKEEKEEEQYGEYRDC